MAVSNRTTPNLSASANATNAAKAQRALQQPTPTKSEALDGAKGVNDVAKIKEAEKTPEAKQVQEPQQVETVRATQEVQDATRIKVKGEENVVKANRIPTPLNEAAPAAAPSAAAAALDGATLLKKGSTGEKVQQLQQTLNDVGAKLREDGDYGNATKQAVRDFQRTQGLTPDGIAGPKTQKALVQAVEMKKDVGFMTDLAKGARGKEVMEMQKMLKAEGGQITPDGIFGKKTEDAIRGFQAANDLPVDGIAGRSTLKALKENTEASAQNKPAPLKTLKAGMKGAEVEQLQNLLLEQGADIKPDGIYGKGTAKAVRDFQRAQGLDQDGVAGVETQEALFKNRAPIGPFEKGVLTRGATGPEVKEAQELLKARGADIGADGVFGVGTERAVRDFQKVAGLYESGTLNAETQKALKERPDLRIEAAKGGPAQAGDLSAADLRRIVPNLSSSKAQKVVPFLNDAMREANINTPMRKAAFVAQLAHESAGFLYMEEIASGKAYEGRRDLGNTQPGDGRRFKGRGYIQVTGRSNYAAASKALGTDFVKNPELASRPENAARVAAWYWNSRNLNKFADKGQFKELTRRINGGYNGLADRRAYYKRALGILK